MKKIAIILSESFSVMRGQANAEINRIKYLQNIADYRIDVYSFAVYDGRIARFLRHSSNIKTPSVKSISGIEIHFKWRAFSIIDYILTVKLHKRPIVNRGWALKYIDIFEDYDMVAAHSDIAGEIALAIKQAYGIPYVVSWHGSDIHTLPFMSKQAFDLTQQILDNATVNLMVSRALLNTASLISEVNNKIVVYNGVSETFQRFEDKFRLSLRDNYNVLGKSVVAFAGNLVPVKDPMVLPEIFKKVYLKNDNTIFWVIGSGKLRHVLENKCAEYNLPVTFWGDVPNEEMVSLYNSMDVLVLPSINEGLPLVVIEALACGVNVVGSNVGGIPEAIGMENVFDRNEAFVENISNRIINIISEDISQELKSCFSWEESARNENDIYKSILML